MAVATVEEITGFISGNVKRKQILDVLDKNGSKTLEDLRKITRTPPVIMQKVLKSMIENGVVVQQDDRFVLTENAKIAAKAMPKQGAMAKAHKYDSNIQHEI
jgi:predicted transcriptional regulator